MSAQKPQANANALKRVEAISSQITSSPALDVGSPQQGAPTEPVTIIIDADDMPHKEKSLLPPEQSLELPKHYHVNRERLSVLLVDSSFEHRRKLAELFKEDLFRPKYNLRMEEERDLILQRVKRIAEEGLMATSFITNNRVFDFLASMETMAYVDFNLQVKCGVHFGLWGGAIVNLGEKQHLDQYLKKTDSLEVRGCFALTELGHGSNARGIQTTITYDPATQTFDVNTPDDLAQKTWIGNAALHGNHAAVFGNLITPTGNHGVHAIVVPIRDANGNLMKGVRIRDCGRKMGLNGVDNGRIWFDHVKVPRENLLSKFGSVAADGSYSTPIKSPGVRFNTMLEALIGGRVAVAATAMSLSKLSLLIATRYGATRTQFGPPKKPEVPILSFLTHQRRLFPLIARTYGLQFAVNDVKARTAELKKAEDLGKDVKHMKRDLFLLAAGFKAAATWNRVEVMQVCRECCGGQGFSAYSRIGVMRGDADVDLTFEGDNTVLYQAVAKALLDEYRARFSIGSGSSGKITRLLSYVGGQVGIIVRNKNFIVSRLTTKAHLRDLETFLEAFIYREFRLLRELANSLTAKSKRMEQFDAWNSCLDQVMHLAQAYVERVTLEKFIENLDRADEGSRHVLKLLGVLYAVSRVEADMGWFLECEYFAPNKARAVSAMVNGLCRRLLPYAIDLVESFGIPEHLVASPTAGNWLASNAYDADVSKQVPL